MDKYTEILLERFLNAIMEQDSSEDHHQREIDELRSKASLYHNEALKALKKGDRRTAASLEQKMNDIIDDIEILHAQDKMRKRAAKKKR